MLKAFVQHFFKAQSRKKISDPFIAALCKEVIDDDRFYYAFAPLKSLRMELALKKEKIDIVDLGAGSRKMDARKRSISNIAKYSVSPIWQCEMLFRLVHFLQPQHKLEMGTSLGISALYQHIPNSQAQFYTLEGCPNIADIAQSNFKRLQAKRIQLLVGNFEQQLPNALQKMGQIDYAFIDGNHSKSATLQYFEQCLAYCKEGSFLIFDDIYWSTEMQSAWEEIKQHPRVKYSIDLFFMGWIVIGSGSSKHYCFRNFKFLN